MKNLSKTSQKVGLCQIATFFSILQEKIKKIKKINKIEKKSGKVATKWVFLAIFGPKLLTNCEQENSMSN